MSKLTLESFIQRGTEKYSGTQGYEQVILVKGTDKVSIRCNIHNEYYFQTPYNHLKNKDVLSVEVKLSVLLNFLHRNL